MGESRIDMPQTPQVTEKAEDEGGKGTQSISSSICQTPEVTKKTEDEGGKTIHSSMLKRGKTISSSSQPPEKANDQVGIPPQSNNVPQMFPLGLFHRLPDGSENIESELALDRQCNFEELVKNMKDDTRKIRKWYVEVERRLSESNTELGRMMDRYSDEDLGRMMARSGLLLLEFLRFLADLPQSSKEFFQPKERQLSFQEIDNRIPIFVLKKILEWERDANKDENRLGSDGDADGDADKDENRGCRWGCRWGCMQIKMKIGEGDADTDLDSILKHALLKLSPIQYDSPDSHVIAGVPLQDDSHLLEFLYENIIAYQCLCSEHAWYCSEYGWKWRKNKRRVRPITLPLAVKLKGKGVKFARNEGSLKAIRFDRRNLTLYLPAIKMDGGTDALLRNLMLFEASKQEKKSQPIMSYVDLMDRLIDTAEDVQVLRDGGIIHSHLSSNNDVANVWNGMRRGLPAEIKYWAIDNAMDEVICFYTSRQRLMYIEFKRRYCSKPWIVLSVISACILLALTVLQTLLAWEQVRLQLKSMNKT